MAGVNRWYGVGNMTADPELKRGDDSDKDRTMFAIAINTSRDGEPTYLDCIAWGKLAGQVKDFGRKGRLVFVDGAIEVRKWETDEGDRKKLYRIKAYAVQFLDKREDDGGRDRDDEPRPKSSSEDFSRMPF